LRLEFPWGISKACGHDDQYCSQQRGKKGHKLGKLKSINMALIYCVCTGCVLFVPGVFCCTGCVLFHPCNALTEITVTVLTEHTYITGKVTNFMVWTHSWRA
jgi:hypothetical protein